MNFGNRHVQGDGLLARLDLLLIETVAELAFDLNVSAFGERGGELGELASYYDSMPLRAAVARAGVVLPARFRGERKRSQLSAVLELARFGIGPEKPNEIDVILEHRNKFSFRYPGSAGAPEKQGGRSQAEGESFLEGDPM